MKRDMDLVRLILLEVEGADGPVNAGTIACDAYPLSTIAYHVELMQAHGLLDANITKAWG